MPGDKLSDAAASEELLRELNNGGSVLEAFGDADDFSMDDVSGTWGYRASGSLG
jgi:hypothetical protein